MTDEDLMDENELAIAARIMGKLGGKARAAALSPERRREIAALAGKASSVNIEQKREAGKKGGRARAAAMTPEQRRERALRAVQARQAREAALTPDERRELTEQRRVRALRALQARKEKRTAASLKNAGDEA